MTKSPRPIETLWSYDRALAVGHRTLRQQANELGHQLLANRPAGFEQLGKILDVTTR